MKNRRAQATDVRGEMGKETPCQDVSCQRSSLRLGVFASENPASAAGQGAASAALTSPIDVHPRMPICEKTLLSQRRKEKNCVLFLRGICGESLRRGSRDITRYRGGSAQCLCFLRAPALLFRRGDWKETHAILSHSSAFSLSLCASAGEGRLPVNTAVITTSA